MPAALRVLRAVMPDANIVEARAGYELFQATGTALPEETLRAVEAADATLFGAVSSPSRPVPGYRSVISVLRQRLGLYANVRPSVSLPITQSRSNGDFVLVGENTEDLYGVREERHDDHATAVRVISRAGSQRIARFACELARREGRRSLTIVHKANILPQTDGLFRDCCHEVAADYPELVVEEMLVDTTALRLVTEPGRFDVIVTTNLFGDILSDEAAGLVGGLGLAPSANIGERAAIFEPVHGSAPDIAGQGIANPLGAIRAVEMLLRHLNAVGDAESIHSAVWATLQAGVMTPDLGGSATTDDVTDAVLSHMEGFASY
ncbi:MAG: homoisocitrate dehydrogenase [Chloroflexota bacterium]